jgi:arsenate reductase (thioredoxin)
MAEAWANHFGGGRVHALSAGSHPFGSIVEETYTVMGEKGLTLDAQCSKGLHDVEVENMDVVVGMGCDVECPVLEGFKGRMVAWEIPDPYGRGIAVFRKVRDIIERKVLELLAEYAVPQVFPK